MNDKIEYRKRVKERLKYIRDTMPRRTAEDTYAQMARLRQHEEATRIRPLDLPYITP